MTEGKRPIGVGSWARWGGGDVTAVCFAEVDDKLLVSIPIWSALYFDKRFIL
jgi:hypothetical protein